VIFKDQAELDACVAKWQKILRLEDWDFNVRLLCKNDIDDGANGTCATILDIGWAEIKISKTPLEADGSPHDMERSLVHELLHVHFNTAIHHARKIGRTELALHERAIDQVARALVSLHRRDG
jgi:hypothetical protein